MITLINHPGLKTSTGLQLQTPSPPIGLAYLGAFLKSKGHAYTAVDACGAALDRVQPYGRREDTWIQGLSVEEVVERVPEDTRVVGFTCLFSHCWPLVLDIAEALRERLPHALLVAGGEHPTALPSSVLEREGLFDVVVKGEGEETFLELVERFEAGKPWQDVDGITWRGGDGQLVSTPPRRRVGSIDDLPTPDWDSWCIEAYIGEHQVTGVNLGRAIPILGSRGCPYRCTFCSNEQMWTRRYIMRDAVALVDEMEDMKQRYGVSCFTFMDSTFVINRAKTLAFCEELVRRNLGVTYQLPAGTRCEAFDEELVRALEASGLRNFAFAPESGSAEVRKAIRKQMELPRFLEAVKLVLRTRMTVGCFFVVGFPEDTPQSLEGDALADPPARLDGRPRRDGQRLHAVSGLRVLRAADFERRDRRRLRDPGSGHRLLRRARELLLACADRPAAPALPALGLHELLRDLVPGAARALPVQRLAVRDKGRGARPLRALPLGACGHPAALAAAGRGVGRARRLMERGARIFVAGHRGLVGSALVRTLERAGHDQLLLRSRDQVDLCDAAATDALFASERPEYVFLAAGRVGGIHANDTHPAEFIDENLAIQTNIIRSAHRHGVTKLLCLGSACIYPRVVPQPIREEFLLSGPLEPTNEGYAVAKIAALVMCRSFKRQFGRRFVAAMPTNLYGPGDNFDLESGHVVPALIRRFHEAKESGGPVTLWGTGRARREFLHVDDASEALLVLMEHYEGDDPFGFLNVGVGEDVTIRELATLVADVVGYDGKIAWDHSRPDGTPLRRLDISRIAKLGWQPSRSLEQGLRETYAWYCAEHA